MTNPFEEELKKLKEEFLNEFGDFNDEIQEFQFALQKKFQEKLEKIIEAAINVGFDRGVSQAQEAEPPPRDDEDYR